MPDLVPVDNDPFASQAPQLVPVDHDPFSTTQQMTSGWRLPAMLGSSVAKGLASAAGLPGDIANAYDKYIGPLGSLITGTLPNWNKPTVKAMGYLAPTSAATTGFTQGQGITDRPDLQPQDEGEKLLSAAGQGIGSALPFGVASGISGLASGVVQGAGAGMGSQVASQLPWLKDHPLLASIVGSLAGAKATGGLTSLGAKAYNLAQGETSPLYQAYQEAGIPTNLAGDVTQNPSLQSMQAFASKAPFGAGRVRDASDQALTAFGNSVDSLADRLGSARTLQEAGQQIQDDGKSWLGNWKMQAKKNWTAVDNAIGSTTPVVPAQTYQVLDDIKNSAGGNAEAESFLKGDVAKQFESILSMSPSAGLGSGVNFLPWQTARALRTRLGEYLESPDLVSSPDAAQAKRLWGALTGDMKDTIANSGNANAADLFATANAHTAAGHDFIKSVLGNVLSKGSRPGDIASNLLSSGVRDGTTLQMMRDNLPDATDNLAAVALRRAATANPGAQNAAGDAVSPSSWLTNTDPTRRLSPEAYSALFPDTVVQRKMGALDQVAGAMRKTEGLVNRSNTAPNMETLAAIAALGEIPSAAILGHDAAGMPGALFGGITAATPLFAGPLASHIGVNGPLARLLSTPGGTGSLNALYLNGPVHQALLGQNPPQ